MLQVCARLSAFVLRQSGVGAADVARELAVTLTVAQANEKMHRAMLCEPLPMVTLNLSFFTGAPAVGRAEGRPMPG